MREIKFRGKRVDNGEWVYGYLIGDDVIVGEIVDFDEFSFSTEFWLKVDPESVGQYTGLKDKNGKEMYEGDIIRYITIPIFDELEETCIDIVTFEEGCFWAEGTEGEKKTQTPMHVIFDPTFYNHVEVIGNIYENPEL